jgi:hypothetical protein
MHDSDEIRRMLADLKWDMTLMFSRAFSGREEGRVFDEALRQQSREGREELLRRVAELDGPDRRA